MKTNLTRKELSAITIETTKKGFTVWIKDGKVKRWILDGSLIKEDGKISLGSDGHLITYYGRINIDGNSIVLQKRKIK